MINKPSKLKDFELQFAYPLRTAVLFVVFLLLYEITTYVANDMIMPGMIYVAHSFHAPESSISLSLSAYILGGASLQLFLGPLSDYYGRRPVMLFGAGFFLICTILISLSYSMDMFILARFLQGMGLCFISVIGYAALQEMFAEKEAVKLISLMGNISIIAPLAGPLAGAILLLKYDWRMIFAVIAFFAAIAAIGLWRYMPETVGVYRKDGSLNKKTMLNFQTIYSNYKALLKNSTFIIGSISLGLGFAPIIAWIGVSPIILMEKAHLGPLAYGLWQMPVFAGITIGNVLVRRLVNHQSLLNITRHGSLILVTSLLAMTFFSYLAPNDYLILIIGYTCYAIGIGMVSAPLNRLILFITDVPKGTASAMISFSTMFLMSLLNFIAGHAYKGQDNFYFAASAGVSVILYACLYCVFVKKIQK